MTVSVSDDGVGVPLEEQEHIFARFCQGNMVETGHIPGTGLGLNIVKEIVQAHGGHFTVESRVAQGGTFTVGLPVGSPVGADEL